MTTNNERPRMHQLDCETGKIRMIPDAIELRDYFAAHASEEDIRYYEHTGRLEDETLRRVDVVTRQEARYMHADAMLAARGE